MCVKIYTGYFNVVDPETFLDYVSAAAKAPCSLTRYNQAGLQLLPRKSKRYIDGKRTFYHPLAIVEFLTSDCLNKGHLLPQTKKNNLTQLQNEDIFFGRIGAYALGLSREKSDCADVNAFKKIIGAERRVLEDFASRTDIVRGKASSIRMTEVDIRNLRHENRRILTGYFDGSTNVAESYLGFVTHLYVHVFMKMYDSEWQKINKLNLVRVEPSPLAPKLIKEEAEERPTGS